MPTVMPWIQPADWPQWRRDVCRQLLSGAYVSPWVACVHDGAESVAALARAEHPDGLAMEKEATANLRARPAEWRVVAEKKGGGARLIAHDGDPYASARIVDADFLRDAEQKLESDHIVVVLPGRNAIYAGTMDDLDALLAFVAQGGAAALSDRAFMARGGAVVAIAEGGAEPPAEPARAPGQGMRVALQLVAADVVGIVRAIHGRQLLGERPHPRTLTIDGAAEEPRGAGWLEQGLVRARGELTAVWADGVTLAWTWDGEQELAHVTIEDHVRDAAALAELLARLPFEVAGVGSVQPWPAERVQVGPNALQVGLGMAFRGPAFEPLVARFEGGGGAWRVHRAGDVALVALHELDADAETARAQLRESLDRMQK
jgi:hypothetical protein